jgi:hypothetical protein
MSRSIASLEDTLKEIDAELKSSPSYLMDTGSHPESPQYLKETQRLEMLQSRLSLAIKEIQTSKNAKGSQAPQSMKYARNIIKRLEESQARSQTFSKAEAAAAATEKVHQYHEMLEVPDPASYYKIAKTPHGASIEDVALFIFHCLPTASRRRSAAGRNEMPPITADRSVGMEWFPWAGEG